MFYNNIETETAAKKTFNEIKQGKKDIFKPTPTWNETFNAGLKNFTSVHLSTSEENYYDDELKPNILEWSEKDPENRSYYERLETLPKQVIENFDNLYSKGKIEAIKNWETHALTAYKHKTASTGISSGEAYLKFKELQKIHGHKDFINIIEDSDNKAKSDYMKSGEILSSSDKWSAKLFGSAVGVLHDPITLATLPLGTWKTGGTILANAVRAIGEEALIETAAQGIIAPKVYSYKKELDIKTSLKEEAYTALTSIATAGMFRGVGSATFDLSAKGIKALKTKDPQLAEDYNNLIKSQVTDNVESHIDNLHKTEFSEDQILEIKNPNEEGVALNEAPPLTEIENVDDLILPATSKIDDDLSMVSGKDIEGTPELKTYKQMEKEFIEEEEILNSLSSCLKGVA